LTFPRRHDRAGGCRAARREASAMEIDTDRIDEATLALLYLGLHDRYL
jgi:hypothetical protein